VSIDRDSLRRGANVAAWLLAFVFGSGWYWQYRSAQIEERRFDAEQVDQRLALRQKVTEKLLAVLALRRNADMGEPDKAMQSRALEDDLVALETQLAKLENREPRGYLYQNLLTPEPPQLGPVQVR